MLKLSILNMKLDVRYYLCFITSTLTVPSNGCTKMLRLTFILITMPGIKSPQQHHKLSYRKESLRISHFIVSIRKSFTTFLSLKSSKKCTCFCYLVVVDFTECEQSVGGLLFHLIFEHKQHTSVSCKVKVVQPEYLLRAICDTTSRNTTPYFSVKQLLLFFSKAVCSSLHSHLFLVNNSDAHQLSF